MKHTSENITRIILYLISANGSLSPKSYTLDLQYRTGKTKSCANCSEKSITRLGATAQVWVLAIFHIFTLTNLSQGFHQINFSLR